MTTVSDTPVRKVDPGATATCPGPQLADQHPVVAVDSRFIVDVASVVGVLRASG